MTNYVCMYVKDSGYRNTQGKIRKEDTAWFFKEGICVCMYLFSPEPINELPLTDTKFLDEILSVHEHGRTLKLYALRTYSQPGVFEEKFRYSASIALALQLPRLGFLPGTRNRLK